MLFRPDAGCKWNPYHRKTKSPGVRILLQLRAARELPLFQGRLDGQAGNCSFFLNRLSTPGCVQTAFTLLISFGWIKVIPFVGQIILL